MPFNRTDNWRRSIFDNLEIGILGLRTMLPTSRAFEQIHIMHFLTVAKNNVQVFHFRILPRQRRPIVVQKLTPIFLSRAILYQIKH